MCSLFIKFHLHFFNFHLKPIQMSTLITQHLDNNLIIIRAGDSSAFQTLPIIVPINLWYTPYLDTDSWLDTCFTFPLFCLSFEAYYCIDVWRADWTNLFISLLFLDTFTCMFFSLTAFEFQEPTSTQFRPTDAPAVRTFIAANSICSALSAAEHPTVATFSKDYTHFWFQSVLTVNCSR